MVARRPASKRVARVATKKVTKKATRKATKKVTKKVKKAKRVSKTARGKLAKSAVFKGRKEKTVGGALWNGNSPRPPACCISAAIGEEPRRGGRTREAQATEVANRK